MLAGKGTCLQLFPDPGLVEFLAKASVKEEGTSPTRDTLIR